MNQQTAQTCTGADDARMQGSALASPELKLNLRARARRIIHGSPALLWGVALVIVFVSLPLLRSVALKENEMDALRALNLLGSEVFAQDPENRDFRKLLEPGSELGRRLPDTRLVGDGRVMFHHGYLFEIVSSDSGERQLTAWPLVYGKSGLGAFWYGAKGGLLGHPNGEAQWSGIDHAPLEPAAPSTPGWRSLKFTSSQDSTGI